MMNMINQLHGQLQAQNNQISSLQQQLSSAHSTVAISTNTGQACQHHQNKTNLRHLVVNPHLIPGLPTWIAMC
jgi:hypothetical protein